MSISIKLDRPALRQLIDSDPDFKLELQRAVLSEVVTNLFQKDVRKILEAGDKAFLKQVGETAAENETIMASIREQLDQMLVHRVKIDYWTKRVTLSADLQKVVDDAVANARSKIQMQISSAITEAAEAKLQALLGEKSIEERITSRVDRLVTQHINTEVDRRVTERLNAIAQGITA